MKIKQKLIEIYECYYEFKRMFIIRTKFRLKIMNCDQTINYILKHKCSIARYGDGEFDHIFQRKSENYQKMSDNLSKDLEKVLDDKNNKNLLICIPKCLNTTKECNKHAHDFWIEWGKKENHHQKIVNMIRMHTGKNYVFGDSQITRPYIDWVSDKRAKRIFPKLKKLWNNRDIIIVEGEQTRLGIGNDLFSNSKSIKRIIVPAEGAYESYLRIKQSILNNRTNDELIIMAIGPTATILAWDLSKLNIQALDIGNIDIEYEWFLQGATERVAIKGKYTNESADGRQFTDCTDVNYLSQIIDKVGCYESK